MNDLQAYFIKETPMQEFKTTTLLKRDYGTCVFL